MVTTVHPFPARMAPELALEAIGKLQKRSVVLDPMAGSGTALGVAARSGHDAIGFDVDPLAVLISRATVSKIDFGKMENIFQDICNKVHHAELELYLPWIDDDVETLKFLKYWFGKEQETVLRRFSRCIMEQECRIGKCIEVDIVKLALSRTIITKDRGASLAQDVSHSRPHKVRNENTFDVTTNVVRWFREIKKYLEGNVPEIQGDVRKGDARNLKDVKNGTVDQIITSPPYLNAIDYFRGHKFSLIWFGYRIDELRALRGSAIGTERGYRGQHTKDELASCVARFGDVHRLPKAQQGMIWRFASDIREFVSECRRVMKRKGELVLIVGNSTIRGVFVQNAEGITHSAIKLGFELLEFEEREIPNSSRYLPVNNGYGNSLNQRMRTETVLKFRKV